MNEKEMAFEIAQEVVRLKAEIESYRIVLDRSRSLAGPPWRPFVEKGLDQLLTQETTHQRYAQLRSAFDAATDDAHLIRALHDQILRRANVL